VLVFFNVAMCRVRLAATACRRFVSLRAQELAIEVRCSSSTPSEVLLSSERSPVDNQGYGHQVALLHFTASPGGTVEPVSGRLLVVHGVADIDNLDPYSRVHVECRATVVSSNPVSQWVDAATTVSVWNR
jgi:hypothetical protein